MVGKIFCQILRENVTMYALFYNMSPEYTNKVGYQPFSAIYLFRVIK